MLFLCLILMHLDAGHLRFSHLLLKVTSIVTRLGNREVIELTLHAGRHHLTFSIVRHLAHSQRIFFLPLSVSHIASAGVDVKIFARLRQQIGFVRFDFARRRAAHKTE